MSIGQSLDLEFFSTLNDSLILSFYSCPYPFPFKFPSRKLSFLHSHLLHNKGSFLHEAMNRKFPDIHTNTCSRQKKCRETDWNKKIICDTTCTNPVFREHSAPFWWVLCSVSLADGKTSASHPQVGAVPFLFVSPIPAFPFQAVSPAAFHSSPFPHSCTYGGEGFSQERGRLSRFFSKLQWLGCTAQDLFHSLYSLHILCSIQHHFIW